MNNHSQRARLMNAANGPGGPPFTRKVSLRAPHAARSASSSFPSAKFPRSCADVVALPAAWGV